MTTERDPSRPIVLHPVTEPPAGISRRVALQALVGGAGAGLVLPSPVDAQHPMHQHLSNPVVLEHAQQQAAAAPYTAVFLDGHQSKTLEALAEAIVPGSTEAKVGPFLDQLLAVESAANQRTFLAALGAFDMAATRKHGRPYVGITAQEQDALLRDASTADVKAPGTGGAFQHLKNWVAGAYYSSEVGMRELGWTGNVFHAQLPGCTHPGGHQD